jgi:hypothetical protein
VINERFGTSRFIHTIVPLGSSVRLKLSEGTYVLSLTFDGAVSNGFCGYRSSGFQIVSRLSRGMPISNSPFLRKRGNMLIKSPYSGGQFFQEGIGYIGFRFNNGGGKQYGWVRVEMPGPPYLEARFKLVDYAWGDPGDRIKAGQTSLAGDQVEAVPDQSSLGLLALGGAGLMAWRKGRAAAAQ